MSPLIRTPHPGREDVQIRTVHMVAAEGAKTEVRYFKSLGLMYGVPVKCIGGGHGSAPQKVLESMEDALARKADGFPFKAWVVIDRDSWDPAQLDKIVKWAQQSPHYHFALSNPNFEYWLLLHLENARRLRAKECLAQIKKHYPNYNKEFDLRRLTHEQILLAISRGKQRDKPPCKSWPRELGVTTVYRLVESILEESKLYR